jgi:hypothetical protein
MSELLLLLDIEYGTTPPPEPLPPDDCADIAAENERLRDEVAMLRSGITTMVTLGETLLLAGSSAE